MILYHGTSEENAESILRDGFRDGTLGVSEEGVEVVGVWLAETPAYGPAVLLVELPDDVAAEYVVHHDPTADDPPHLTPPREWFVPAAVVNSAGRIRVLSDEEIAVAADARL